MHDTGTPFNTLLIAHQGHLNLKPPHRLTWKQQIYHHLECLGFDLELPPSINSDTNWQYEITTVFDAKGTNFYCVCIDHCIDNNQLFASLHTLVKQEDKPILVFTEHSDYMSCLIYLDWLLKRTQ